MKKNTFLLALSALMSLSAVAENQPFLTKVYDFMPAPGQFVNTLPAFLSVEKASCGHSKASLQLKERVMWSHVKRYRPKKSCSPACMVVKLCLYGVGGFVDVYLSLASSMISV